MASAVYSCSNCETCLIRDLEINAKCEACDQLLNLSEILEDEMSEPKIITAAKARGFKVFERFKFDMNIIIARNPKREPNKFCDRIFVCYLDEKKEWVNKSWIATSTPGDYWLQFPMRSNGCAVLKHDKCYRGAFKVGSHKGRYECLVSAKELDVWRDNDRDVLIDYGELESSKSWGIQIHRAGARWKARRNHDYLVGRYSAGCVVIPFEFDQFMDTVKLQIQHHAKWRKFSLTVIELDPEGVK